MYGSDEDDASAKAKIIDVLYKLKVVPKEIYEELGCMDLHVTDDMGRRIRVWPGGMLTVYD